MYNFFKRPKHGIKSERVEKEDDNIELVLESDGLEIGGAQKTLLKPPRSPRLPILTFRHYHILPCLLAFAYLSSTKHILCSIDLIEDPFPFWPDFQTFPHFHFLPPWHFWNYAQLCLIVTVLLFTLYQSLWDQFEIILCLLYFVTIQLSIWFSS